MKRFAVFLFLGACLLAPLHGLAETLPQAVSEAISSLDLEMLSKAVNENEWLDGDAGSLLTALASGKAVLTGEQVLAWLWTQLAGVFTQSLWRMTRLMAPALLVAAAEQLHAPKNTSGKAARYAGLLMTMGFLVADMHEHVALSNQAISEMSGLMQGIFPLMVTLLAAVGGTASSAFYQPAVMAAAGTMTTLVQHVTMPFAISVATLTMVGGMSESLRVSKLCRLFRQAANWTLGLGLTVFIGVMTVQGMGAAAVDGVSIRTAKYAMDNFIPIVGGMFADTVDTLVGCSLLIQNAVGVLGLLLLLGKLLLPLLRTVATLFLYRATAALLEPMSDNPLCRCIGDYADVFSLLLIIQMSVGAMFILLVAQLLTVGNLTVMLR
ncbi:MAG: stage III sporulation protein AE [Clostridia bacterium]